MSNVHLTHLPSPISHPTCSVQIPFCSTCSSRPDREGIHAIQKTAIRKTKPPRKRNSNSNEEERLTNVLRPALVPSLTIPFPIPQQICFTAQHLLYTQTDTHIYIHNFKFIIQYSYLHRLFPLLFFSLPFFTSSFHIYFKVTCSFIRQTYNTLHRCYKLVID